MLNQRKAGLLVLGVFTTKNPSRTIDRRAPVSLSFHQELVLPMFPMQSLLQSGYFVQFAYLQALDLLSTTAFLLNGVAEANPMVRWTMAIAPNPITGLVAIKVIGLGLALWCIRMGRDRLLFKINVFFAALVAWNLVCLILSSHR